MKLKHNEGWTIPADSPFYPPLPALYRNVKFQVVFFYADPGAIGQFLPEPLVESADGLCAVAGMDVPDCTNYGSFREAFVVLRCLFDGNPGFYCSHVFHDGPAGIAAGREIYGTPKIFAGLNVGRVERAMTTEARMAGEVVLRIATATGQAVSPEEVPRLTPSWRLKLIPRADGPGPAVKQLIDCTRATRDQVVHFCARANGTVSFAASPLVDLTPLQPVRYESSFVMEASYSEHYAEIAYDYLKQSAASGQ